MRFSPILHNSLDDIVKYLCDQHETLSVAESCTGGLIGSVCTERAGSSEWFDGGAIVYQNDLKIRLLNVAATTIEIEGVVSASCVSQMLAGAISLFQSDWAIAVSGIAGPGGGTPEKPVGLVYVGVRGPSCEKVTQNFFSGNREEIRIKTVEKGLEMLKLAFFERDADKNKK